MNPSVKYFLTSAVAASEDDPGMTISTMAVDREGDRVVPEGGDFSKYLKNPVLVWSHDYSNIPIGSVTALEVVQGEGVKATWKWLQDDPFADRIKNAWNQGIVRASSIGFIARDTQPNETGGRDIKNWEMLELSLCAIPMNPDAVRAMKSIGLLDETKAVVHDKSVPANVSTKKAPADTAWSAPSLKDFTAKGWDELSASERTHIDGHFAWKDGDTFGDLHLPHHRPSDGAVVFRGVAAAAARLNQTQGVDEKAVKAHLGAHYKAFKKTPPWDKASLPETVATLKQYVDSYAQRPDDDETPDIQGVTAAINLLQAVAAHELAEDEAHAVLIRDAVNLLITFLQQEFAEQFAAVDDTMSAVTPPPSVARPTADANAGGKDEPFVDMDPDDYPYVSVSGVGEGYLVAKDVFAKGRGLPKKLMKALHDAHAHIKAAGEHVGDVLTSAGQMSNGQQTDKPAMDGSKPMHGNAPSKDLELDLDADDFDLGAIDTKAGDDFEVDPADLRAALREAVPALLRDELRTATEAALNAARGRLN